MYFFSTEPATTEIYTLSLHDALPISGTKAIRQPKKKADYLLRYRPDYTIAVVEAKRSEEHTSELQSHSDLVCRLLLEKKKEDHSEKTMAVLVQNKYNFRNTLIKCMHR